MIFLLALGMRCLLLQPAFTPDSRRFLDQAEGLREGRGFLWEGQPTTTLPPGYPLFLALLGLASTDATIIVLANVLLSSLACVVVLHAVRALQPRLAFACAFALALNPWLAIRAGYVLSESLSAFLCAGLLASLVWHRQKGTSFLSGLLIAALPLTAPGTVALAGALGLLTSWRLRKNYVQLAGFVLGVAVLLAPWQIYCWAATERFDLSLWAPPQFPPGLSHWVETWLVDQTEDSPIWSGQFDTVPASAFGSAEIKAVVVAATADRSPAGAAALDERLEGLAQSRLREHPFLYGWLPIGRRVLSLWTSMPPLSHANPTWANRASRSTFLDDQHTVGSRRAVKRLLKGMGSALAVAVYVAHAGAFLALLILAGRVRWPLGIAIVVGVATYTVVSAYTALGETRRNFPFYPALYCLVGAVAPRSAFADEGRRDPKAST